MITSSVGDRRVKRIETRVVVGVGICGNVGHEESNPGCPRKKSERGRGQKTLI